MFPFFLIILNRSRYIFINIINWFKYHYFFSLFILIIISYFVF
ncbi:hypothetical protein [Plasmodium yoelii yoelii]|uniref:Uncharacterized protein n=1 Tax=Plasmodium yoelii yoelii TaxID=73239 RepID=Q7RQN7_PLAYO|nr:hypothetical protein [Plasmodium yoelii yoelii]